MKTNVFTTVLLFSSFCVAASEPVPVSFKDHLGTPTAPVLMRDIIDTQNTAIDFVRDYGSVIVCTEQEVCDSIDQTRVFAALFQAGAPVSQIQFHMNGPVTIEQGQKIDVNSDLQTKIASIIASNFNIPANDIRVEQAKILPHLDADFSKYTVRNVTARDLKHLAKSRLGITLEDADGNKSEHDLFTKINIETQVITASSALAMGDALEDHYVSGRQKLNSLKEKILTNSDLTGKSYKLTQDVSAEQILTQNMVHVSEVIKQGTVVTLSYNSGMISVRTQGKLEAAAEVGSMVEVENVDSKQVVTGRLVTKDRVEVASAK